MPVAQLVCVRWLEVVIASGLLLAVASMAIMRLKQPADRITAILLSFSLAVSLPFLGLLLPLPRWELAWLPVQNPSQVSEARPTRTQSDPPLVLPALPDERSDSVPGIDLPSLPGPIVAAESESQFSPIPDEIASESVVPSFGWDFGLDGWMALLAILAAVHFAVWAKFMFEDGWGWLALRRLDRRSDPAPPDLIELWRELTHGRGSFVRLRLISGLATPMVFGVFKPTILIPWNIATSNREVLRFCLLHEWAHVVHGDLKGLVLVRMARFLLWMQPCFWYLLREFRLCQDYLADHGAAGQGSKNLEYSEMLMELARNRMAPSVPGSMALFERTSQIALRIRRLLVSDLPLRLKTDRRLSVLIGLGFLLVGLSFGAVRLHAQPERSSRNESIGETVDRESIGEPKPEPGEPTKRLHGLVVDDQGRGLPGAQLLLPIRYDSRESVFQSVTDDTGRFAMVVPSRLWDFRKLDAVSGILWAKAPGWNLGGTSVYRLGKPDETSLEVKIELTPETSLTVKVLDPSGNPLSGVKVQPRQHQFPNTQGIVPAKGLGSFQSRTDTQGVAQIMGLNPKLVTGFLLNHERYGTQTISLEKIKDFSTRTLRLKSTGSVKGRLSAPRAEWAQGVKIHLHSLYGAKLGQAEGLAEVTTDAQGRFEIPHLAAEDSLVIQPVVDPSLPVRPLLIKGPWKLEAETTLEIEIELVPATKVRGSVIVKNKRTPVDTAVVSFRHGGLGWERALTNEKGEFEGFVLAGKVQIDLAILRPDLMDDLGYPARYLEIPRVDSEYRIPPIEVFEMKTRKGKLVGIHQEPVPEKQILARLGDRTIRAKAETDALGEFTVDLPEGADWKLEVEDYLGFTQPLDIVQKDPLVVTWTNKELHQAEFNRNKNKDIILKGKLILNEKPGAGIQMCINRYIHWEVGSQRHSTNFTIFIMHTDKNGQFEVTGLKENDEYTFSILDKGLKTDVEWQYLDTHQGKIPILPKGTNEFVLPDITVRRLNQTLSGQVVDTAGKPVSRARVVALTRIRRIPVSKGYWYSGGVLTDHNGRFELTDLPDTPLRVMAFLPSKKPDPGDFPASKEVKLNQKDIRIVLDPTLMGDD